MHLVSGDNGNDGKETFYLPHYLAFQHNISTTKLRVTFDTGAISTMGLLK